MATLLAEQTKVCTGCNQDKPLEDFARRSCSPDGLQYRCRECVAEYSRQHYERNREDYIERAAQWQSENRERRRETLREWSLQNKYGISQAEFDEMSERQEGRCAICGEQPELLVVDHDHDSGRVRGLLCDRCNMGIGLLQESAFVLDSARAYLAQEGVMLHGYS